MPKDPLRLDIWEAEENLQDAKKQFLKCYGWSETCNTPGSYWVWKREFEQYGLIMAPLDLAVSMMKAYLSIYEDEEEE